MSGPCFTFGADCAYMINTDEWYRDEEGSWREKERGSVATDDKSGMMVGGVANAIQAYAKKLGRDPATLTTAEEWRAIRWAGIEQITISPIREMRYVKLYPNRNVCDVDFVDIFRLNLRYVGFWRALWYALGRVIITSTPAPLMVLDNMGISKADVEAAMRRGKRETDKA